MIEYFCRICGLKYEDPPWGDDGQTPTHEICLCCEVEFGCEDYNYESIINYRNEWQKKGAGWAFIKYKPSNWDKALQIKNIPDKYL